MFWKYIVCKAKLNQFLNTLIFPGKMLSNKQNMPQASNISVNALIVDIFKKKNNFKSKEIWIVYVIVEWI